MERSPIILEIEALLKETNQSLANSAKYLEQQKVENQEWYAELKEMYKNHDKMFAEHKMSIKNQEKMIADNKISIKKQEKMLAELQRMNKKHDKDIGAITNGQGEIAEEYFFNSLKAKKRNIFGEKYAKIIRNMRGYAPDDEYDIVLINCSSVVIVEVKSRANQNNLPSILKKVNTFRENFPKFCNHRIYLALASFVIHPNTEKKFLDQGVAIIKQVGKTIVVHDKNLKAY